MGRLDGGGVSGARADRHPAARPLGPGLRLRRAERGDEAALLTLFGDVFGYERSQAEWQWRYLRAPDGAGLSFVVEHEGGIVGHSGHVPFPVWVGGEPMLLAHGGDSMVDVPIGGEGCCGSSSRSSTESRCRSTCA
jgi:hypothetical protein